MALGMDHTTQIWEAVEKVDLNLFYKSHQKLLHPTDRALQHVPLKVYLPAAAVDDGQGKVVHAGHLRVVQGLVTPMLSSRMLFDVYRKSA
jgi:autophagy-related protein 5